jgi:multidrug efflux system membrane fusion protein
MGLTRTVAAVAFVGIVIAGVFAYHVRSAAVAPAPEPVKAVLTLKTAVAEKKALTIAISGIGNLQALNSVQIKSRVDGSVDKVLFREGELVTPGEALLQIDPRLYRAAVAQAEAQLAHDQAEYQAAQAKLDRFVKLADKGFTSQDELQQSQATVAEFQAAIKMDRAGLELAQLNLDFTTIRAPIAGRIGKRLVDAGNLVRAADGTSLTEIVQIQPISGFFTVPQSNLADIYAQMQAGPVVVEAMSTDNRRVLSRGRLVLIENRIDPQSGTVELKAEFDNRAGSLWAGQLFEARLILRTQTAVSVPTAAISAAPGGKIVFVIDGEHKVRLRKIIAGPNVEGMTVVESGLATGERVAIEKLDSLAPGVAVQLQEPTAQTADAGST